MGLGIERHLTSGLDIISSNPRVVRPLVVLSALSRVFLGIENLHAVPSQ